MYEPISHAVTPATLLRLLDEVPVESLLVPNKVGNLSIVRLLAPNHPDGAWEAIGYIDFGDESVTLYEDAEE